MIRTARFLPLVTVAAWVITLALPILDSGNAQGPRIVVSSLGGRPFDLSEAQPEFLLAWVAVLGCAGSVWLFRSLRWWSIVAMLVAVLLGALLLELLIDPPYLLWDGEDDRGLAIGGMEIGKPAAGALVCAIGVGALLAAGICGFIGRPRRRT